MPRRSKVLSGTLVASALLLTSIGIGTVAANADTPAASAPARAAHSGHTMAVSTAASP